MNPDDNNPIANPPQDQITATPNEVFAGQDPVATPETSAPLGPDVVMPEPPIDTLGLDTDQTSAPELALDDADAQPMEYPESTLPDLENPGEPLMQAPEPIEPAAAVIDSPVEAIVPEQPPVVPDASEAEPPVVPSEDQAPSESTGVPAPEDALTQESENVITEPAAAPVVAPPTKKDNKTRTIILAIIAGLILIAGIAVVVISQL